MATDLRVRSDTIVKPDKDTFLNEENPFEAMMLRFDRAAELLDLEPGLYKVLRHPEKQIIISIPIGFFDRVVYHLDFDSRRKERGDDRSNLRLKGAFIVRAVTVVVYIDKQNTNSHLRGPFRANAARVRPDDILTRAGPACGC